MKLGLLIGYSPARVAIDMERVHEAERLGFDAAWTAEAYGSDAVSPSEPTPTVLLCLIFVRWIRNNGIPC